MRSMNTVYVNPEDLEFVHPIPRLCYGECIEIARDAINARTQPVGLAVEFTDAATASGAPFVLLDRVLKVSTDLSQWAAFLTGWNAAMGAIDEQIVAFDPYLNL